MKCARPIEYLLMSLFLLVCLAGQTFGCIDVKQSRRENQLSIASSKTRTHADSASQSRPSEETTTQNSDGVAVGFDPLSDGYTSEDPVGMFFLGALVTTPIAFMTVRRQRHRISVRSIL